MTGRRILIVVLLWLLAALPSAAAPEQTPSAQLEAAIAKRHLVEAVRVFGGLSHPSPLIPRAGTSHPSIVVHAGAPTAWTTPVLRAMPEFDAVGRRIFGKDVPAVRFYLFSERPVYDRFFGAMFGAPTSIAWQDGTGNLNVVVYCETNARGVVSRPAGEPETIGTVLHEFGHAWCGTYLMDRYDLDWLGPSIRRPWLDEGIADYVATVREPAFRTRRMAWLREKAAKGVAAPAWKDLVDYNGFYGTGDPDVRYRLSALLVAELLGDAEKAPQSIRKILDETGRTGEVDGAVRAVTGKEPAREFEILVRRFWQRSGLAHAPSGVGE